MNLFKVSILSFLMWLLVSDVVFASMSSANYEIRFDEVAIGGDNEAESASFQLRDAIGGTAPGLLSGDTYSINGQYRAGIYDEVATFRVFIQDKASQVGAVSFAGLQVQVTNATGFFVGQMIVVVQDEGQNQKTAVGRVAEVDNTDLTVDFWTSIGAPIVLDGVNDYVYRLNGSAVALGVLDPAYVSTGVVAWEVNADIDNGHSVYVFENQELRTPTSTIPDVNDGLVNAGSSEYGGRSSDTTLASSTFDTQDTAITNTYKLVGSRSETAFKSRDFLLLKAAVASSQPGGSYGHTLSFVYVGGY